MEFGIVHMAYILAALLFIMALAGLSKQETAKRWSILEICTGSVRAVHKIGGQAGFRNKPRGALHPEPHADSAAQPFQESFPGPDIDDSSAAFGIILC